MLSKACLNDGNGKYKRISRTSDLHNPFQLRQEWCTNSEVREGLWSHEATSWNRSYKRPALRVPPSCIGNQWGHLSQICTLWDHSRPFEANGGTRRCNGKGREYSQKRLTLGRTVTCQIWAVASGSLGNGHGTREREGRIPWANTLAQPLYCRHRRRDWTGLFRPLRYNAHYEAIGCGWNNSNACQEGPRTCDYRVSSTCRFQPQVV